MTNAQLFIAIGIPIVFNFAIMGSFFLLLNSNMNTRMDMLERSINKRIDDLREDLRELRGQLFPSQKHKTN